MLQQWADQRMEQLGSCVLAVGTAVVCVLLCWKKADPGQMADSGDLLNWSKEGKKKRNVS